MTGRVVAAASVPDVGAFLARLCRLDPATLVRLRPVAGGPDRFELWARLPFGVLVTRSAFGEVAADTTVRAAELLAGLPVKGLPGRHDEAWRGALPPAPGPVIEEVPAEALERIAAAAAGTLRAGQGRGGVGERRIRDAILDHVAITLTAADGTEVVVPTRVVTAVVRMGFLGTDPVRFGTVGPWLAAHATFGTVWYRTSPGLTLERAGS